MVNITIDTFTIIGLFISMGGLIAVILYNSLKIKQNTKSQYYQILKDLHERFHNIQDIQGDGPKYIMYVSNFGSFIKELIDAKIIPKKLVVTPYKYLFCETLWIYNRMDKKPRQEKDTQDFIKFCQENKFEEKKPPQWAIKNSQFED